MKIPKLFLSWQLNPDNSILINCDSSYTKIYLMSDDIIRLRTSFTNEFSEESYILTTTAWDDRFDQLLATERKKINALVPLTTENAHHLIISTATLDITINKSPFYIQIHDQQQNLVYSDLKSRPYTQDQLGRVTHYTEIDLENDSFYGFGEKTGAINKLRRRLVQNAKDTLAYDPEFSDPLYKHIPFYIKLNQQTQAAVGFFYHNSYESVFDMGVEHSNYHHRYSSFCADGGDLDLFIINGPSMAKVVEGYSEITGKSAMLPAYALGYLGSTMYYVELPENCDREIVNFVKKCRQEDIPIDNFHLSSGYTVDQSNKRQLFTWNQQRFPNPSDFFQQMHANGAPVTPNIKPGVLLTNPNYPTMEAKQIFIGQSTPNSSPYVDYWWGGLGSFVDFTNPVARQTWSDYLDATLLKNGVTSLWNDNCEYDSLTDRSVVCNFDGKLAPLAQLKSIQPNLMALTGRQALLKHNPNLRPYSVNRGGFAGIQRYSQTWAGDNMTSWKSLKFNIATILGMGLSGVANNGCDIGGFWGPHPDAELFVRWVQNGIFQPRFSIHSCNTDNTVTEPWMFQDKTHLIRAAIKLRYRLMPYFYALMRAANLHGTPIMRPTFYEFQHDPQTYNQGIDFMLGSSLLVANVVEAGADSRQVYLPIGSNWYDFYTRQAYTGGQTISLPVELSSIPLFIRDSAILALNENEAKQASGNFPELRLILGGANAQFALYQDDGISQEYLHGNYRETLITLTREKEQTLIDFQHNGDFVAPTQELYLELINPQKGPFWISVAGNKIAHFLHRDKFNATKTGWYYSNSKGCVEIKLDFPNRDSQIIVSFAHFDLIGM